MTPLAIRIRFRRAARFTIPAPWSLILFGMRLSLTSGPLVLPLWWDERVDDSVRRRRRGDVRIPGFACKWPQQPGTTGSSDCATTPDHIRELTDAEPHLLACRPAAGRSGAGTARRTLVVSNMNDNTATILDAARGGALSFLASIDAGGAQVALSEIERSHPCASLSPGDNLIAVTSARYSERPLVIRGPGAGPNVTAAGVFADILRASLESR